MAQLSNNQSDLIFKLLKLQAKFESPSEENLTKLTPFTLGNNEREKTNRMIHMTEMTVLTTELIVEFAKEVPGFDTLIEEDRISLLKDNVSSIMMLKATRKYNKETDSIIFGNNQSHRKESFHLADMGELGDALFEFCRYMSTQRFDEIEYALLTVIILFTKKAKVCEMSKIEKLKLHYSDLLKEYMTNNRSSWRRNLCDLPTIMTKLRVLSEINSKQCFRLKINNKLPPLLESYIDDYQSTTMEEVPFRSTDDNDEIARS